MASVLLTRPQNTSAQLAKELQRLGHTAFIEPLLTIRPTGMPRPTSEPQAVIFTSANALVALEENNEDVTSLLSLPSFCVGARTAAKARSFGFQNIENSEGDGTELALLVARTLTSTSKPLLHIAGKDTNSKATAELAMTGYTVAYWPVYAAQTANNLTIPTIERFEKRELDAILLFSPRTAETLLKLIRQNMLEACCSSITAIGLSDDVTAKLQHLNWKQLVAAPRPTEEAVINCLKESLPAA